MTAYPFREQVKRDRQIGFSIAVAVHLLIFFIGGFALKGPQYGVASQTGGMEVSLTAALPSAVERRQDLNLKAVQLTTGGADFRLDEITKKKAGKKAKAEGDGSSAEPGENATTFYSRGGAMTEAKPKSFRNRPPKYPQQAIEGGQEGVVLLLAHISESGLPAKVDIKQSSGSATLDKAALEAVQKWKFEPARLGRLPVAADLEIPVRFSLEEYKKSLG